MGGWTGGTHTSSHMGSSGIPAGRNTLFLDGHVDWAAFNNTTSLGNNTQGYLISTNGTVTFYW